MPVADIFNIPEDDTTLNQWSFAHMDHHRLLIDYIFRTKGVSLPIYPLDPVNPADFATFGYQHQVMHNDQNKILGIDGQDLLDVDWSNPTQRAAWIWLNATEHLQALNKTGVG